ncbi:MAG: hypothetical protein IJP15_06145 [Oscillospiraceae bacterium]|nr:hypothetical protein [Oscillospiraceae bacterium]
MNELQKQFDALVEAIAAYSTGNQMGQSAAILRFKFVVDAALEALTEALLDRQVVVGTGENSSHKVTRMV